MDTFLDAEEKEGEREAYYSEVEKKARTQKRGFLMLFAFVAQFMFLHPLLVFRLNVTLDVPGIEKLKFL